MPFVAWPSPPLWPLSWLSLKHTLLITMTQPYLQVLEGPCPLPPEMSPLPEYPYVFHSLLLYLLSKLLLTSQFPAPPSPAPTFFLDEPGATSSWPEALHLELQESLCSHSILVLFSFFCVAHWTMSSTKTEEVFFSSFSPSASGFPGDHQKMFNDHTNKAHVKLFLEKVNSFWRRNSNCLQNSSWKEEAWGKAQNDP